MKYQKLLECSEAFWKTYEHALGRRDNIPFFTCETERLRYLMLLGFTALDASLTAFWHSRVTPEWAEYLSLIYAYLEDEEEFDRLEELAEKKITRGQLKASLRFIENTGTPEKFSPSFVDCGAILLLIASAHEKEALYQKCAKILFHLQKIRNAAFHTGRGFNELQGNEALILFNQWVALATELHPVFSMGELAVAKARAA